VFPLTYIIQPWTYESVDKTTFDDSRLLRFARLPRLIKLLRLVRVKRVVERYAEIWASVRTLLQVLKKSVLFVHFLYRIIILPRQARDKHRETLTETRTVFFLAAALRHARAHPRDYPIRAHHGLHVVLHRQPALRAGALRRSGREQLAAKLIPG
jgi:hypothetical protein